MLPFPSRRSCFHVPNNKLMRGERERIKKKQKIEYRRKLRIRYKYLGIWNHLRKSMFQHRLFYLLSSFLHNDRHSLNILLIPRLLSLLHYPYSPSTVFPALLLFIALLLIPHLISLSPPLFLPRFHILYVCDPAPCLLSSFQYPLYTSPFEFVHFPNPERISKCNCMSWGKV